MGTTKLSKARNPLAFSFLCDIWVYAQNKFRGFRSLVSSKDHKGLKIYRKTMAFSARIATSQCILSTIGIKLRENNFKLSDLK